MRDTLAERATLGWLQAGRWEDVGIADRLADAFAAAAQRTGADLIAASARTAEHAIGSSEPWVTGFRASMRPLPFHPNAAGMQAVADAIYRHVTS